MTRDELSQELPYLLSELALYALNAGAVDRAEEFWAGLTAQNSEHPLTRMLAGMIHVAKGNFSDAETEYRNVLEMDPEYPGAQALLAEALIGQKRWQEAAELLRGVVTGAQPQAIHQYATELQEALQKGDLQRAMANR